MHKQVDLNSNNINRLDSRISFNRIEVNLSKHAVKRVKEHLLLSPDATEEKVLEKLSFLKNGTLVETGEGDVYSLQFKAINLAFMLKGVDKSVFDAMTF